MESTKDCEMLDQNTDPQFVMEQVKYIQYIGLLKSPIPPPPRDNFFIAV